MQKKSQYVPTSLCVGEACIGKDNLLMINGDSTVKLKESGAHNYLQPTNTLFWIRKFISS